VRVKILPICTRKWPGHVTHNPAVSVGTNSRSMRTTNVTEAASDVRPMRAWRTHGITFRFWRTCGGPRSRSSGDSDQNEFVAPAARMQ